MNFNRYLIFIFCLNFIFSQNYSYKDLPILESGRIKPFSTFAENQLLVLYGKRSFKTDTLKVDAIDYSEPMLVKARKRQENGDFVAKINFQQMDAHVLEFENNSFDHCVVAHTLAVVAEPEVVLREIVRVTKPSGLIAIVNHYKDSKGIIGTIWNPFRKRLGLGKHVDFKDIIEKCNLELLSEERVNNFTTHTRMLVCKNP